MKTWKNKLSAIAMLGCGYVGVLIENDATALVFLAMFAVPLFFAKENWVYKIRAANNGSFLFRQKYIVYYGNNLKGDIKEYGRNEDWIKIHNGHHFKVGEYGNPKETWVRCAAQA